MEESLSENEILIDEKKNDPVDETDTKKITTSELIDHLGFGPYQTIIFIVCGKFYQNLTKLRYMLDG